MRRSTWFGYRSPVQAEAFIVFRAMPILMAISSVPRYDPLQVARSEIRFELLTVTLKKFVLGGGNR
jgi:hypothetical protein